jgi:hypothetical protein
MAEMPVIDVEVRFTEPTVKKWGIWGFGCGWLEAFGSPASFVDRSVAEAVIYETVKREGGHYEVRPYPAPSACPDCKAAPCDCEMATWGFYWRDSGEKRARFSDKHKTRYAAVQHHRAASTSWDCGPVQRVTDPPHRFEEAKAEENLKLEVLCAYCQYALADCQCNSGRLQAYSKFVPPFTMDSLARALFDVEMLQRGPNDEPSEAERRAEGMNVDHVLDVMWAKTKPEARARAEHLATAVLGRLSK